MKNKQKTFSFFRLLLVFVSVLLGIAILAGLICAAEYYHILRNPKAPEILSAASFQNGKTDAVLGESLVCRTVIRAPWGSSPEAPGVTPGTGTQLIADPVFRSDKIGWGTTDWVLELRLQPYRTGGTGKGTLQFSFRGPEGNTTMFEQEIPSLSVQEVATDPADSELVLAQKLTEKQNRKYMYWVAAAVVLAVVILIWIILFVFRRKKDNKPVKTLRETALDAIRMLRTRVEKRQEAVEAALAELTDIVRHFLEKQYSLRAERQTTAEFLHDLDRTESPMPEPDRKFLRRFLEAADMVKFARIPADLEVFDNAAIRAEKLIGEANPEEVEGGKKR